MYESPSQQPGGAFQAAPGPSYATNYVGPETAQEIIDNEHLRLLRIGYFISAAQTAIFIPFGLLYAGMGLLMAKLPSGGAPPPPAMMSWIFGVFGAAFAGFATIAATLKAADRHPPKRAALTRDVSDRRGALVHGNSLRYRAGHLDVHGAWSRQRTPTVRLLTPRAPEISQEDRRTEGLIARRAFGAQRRTRSTAAARTPFPAF
jgi:hypothetical protein